MFFGEYRGVEKSGTKIDMLENNCDFLSSVNSFISCVVGHSKKIYVHYSSLDYKPPTAKNM